MALAIDSQEASNLAHRLTTAGPLTWSFTNTAGTALFVAVELTSSSAAPTFGAVTYNSVALALVTGSNVSWDTSHSQIQWYYLTNAASNLATGAHTVSVSYTNSGTNHAVLASAISFTGANQSTPFGTPVTHSTSGAGGTSDSVVVPGTTSGNNVISAIGSGSAQPTATSPTVKSAGITGSTGTGGDNFTMGQQPAGGSITAAYTFTSDIDGMVAFEVLAASAAAAFIPPHQRVRPVIIPVQLRRGKWQQPTVIRHSLRRTRYSACGSNNPSYTSASMSAQRRSVQPTRYLYC